MINGEVFSWWGKINLRKYNIKVWFYIANDANCDEVVLFWMMVPAQNLNEGRKFDLNTVETSADIDETDKLIWIAYLIAN